MEYSLDNGITWHQTNNPVRVILRDPDAGFGDGEMKELHVKITGEGIICDVIDSDTGELLATRAETTDLLIDELVQD